MRASGREKLAGREALSVNLPTRGVKQKTLENRHRLKSTAATAVRLPRRARPGPARLGDAYSDLGVVWFQDDYAPPITRMAFEWIRDLDWAREATHWTMDDL
jgi:hypothetical protein